MATVTLQGEAINTSGDLPKTGSKAPDFELPGVDLKPVALKDFQNKNVILNIFPSLDTSTCAMTVRKFNERASELKDTVVLAISADLPFAQKRFCSTENIKNVIPLSVFRNSDFGKNYGVLIVDGAIKGLLARTIVVIGKDGNVIYTELVNKIEAEPDYEKALNSVK